MKPAILIVEDEAVVAADLGEVLARSGYAVCGIAASGAEALALARQHRPALALMDIRIRGGMDGVRTAEILRNELDVPVIFLSAHSDEATLQRAKGSAPYGFLVKPFDERELQLNIEVALSRHEGERQLAGAHEQTRRANEALEALAAHDPLTGLANRRKFTERFDHDMALSARNGVPLSVLMIDIDHFKAINDRHGHMAGDACLKALAGVMHESVREMDLVARFGGDEFIALLPDTPEEKALLVGERMRRDSAALSVTSTAGSEPVRFTISVGEATTSGGVRSLEQLLGRADEAVYRAKRAGRNYVSA